MSFPDELTEQIQYICDTLIYHFSPVRIISFGEKTDKNSGDITDIDLCVIGIFEDKKEAQRTAYKNIDSDIPFDLFFYNVSEWDSLSDEEGTFADRIKRKGRVIYEKTL